MISDTIDAAQRKYRKDGPISLVKSVPRYSIRQLAHAPFASDNPDYVRKVQDEQGEPDLSQLDVDHTRIIDREELHRIAEREGQVWQYEPGRDFAIEPREFAFKLPNDFTKRHRKYRVDPSYVYELKECTIVGDFAVCFYDSKAILNSARNDILKLGLRLHNTKPYDLLRSLRPSVFSADMTMDCVFPMTNDHRNYAAWLLEYLPKLRALETYNQRTGRKPTILINEDPPAYLEPSLDFFGFNHYDIVENTYGIINAERVVLGTHRRRNVIGKDQPHPTGYEWIRKRTQEILSNESGLNERPNRLYISRDDVQDRRPANNEQEVVERLEELGFEKIVPSYLPFDEQVKHFHNADIAVGIHGSGFYNQVFGTDFAIMEVVPPNKEDNPGVYQIARIYNYGYEFIPSPGNNKDGVDVDINTLCDEIQKYLHERD